MTIASSPNEIKKLEKEMLNGVTVWISSLRITKQMVNKASPNEFRQASVSTLSSLHRATVFNPRAHCSAVSNTPSHNHNNPPLCASHATSLASHPTVAPLVLTICSDYPPFY
ncbi:hypothetical protein SESBI_50315 [Sesbania bispinosa]|nr:hypothetical protein SESBI_50315 [Sesbania bispinosa]